MVAAAVQIQTNWSSVCRRHAQTNSVTRIHVGTEPPSFPLSFTHPQKQTRYMFCDLVSQDQWSCLFFEISSENNTGMEIPFSQKPRVKPILGMCSCWQRAEVEHKCDSVCAVCMGLEVGPVLGAKISSTGAKLWLEVKIEPLVFRRYLVGMKARCNKSRGAPLLRAGKWESSLALQPDHSLPRFFTVSLWMLGSSTHKPNTSLQTQSF